MDSRLDLLIDEIVLQDLVLCGRSVFGNGASGWAALSIKHDAGSANCGLDGQTATAHIERVLLGRGCSIASIRGNRGQSSLQVPSQSTP